MTVTMSAEQNATHHEDSSDLPEQPTDLRTRKKDEFGSDSETDNDIDVTSTDVQQTPSFLIRNLIDGGRNPEDEVHPPPLRAFHPLLHPPLHMFHPHHPFHHPVLHPALNHHRESDTEDYDKTDTERDPSVTSGDEDKLRFKDEEDEDQDDVTSSKDSQHAADSDLENSVNHSSKWHFVYLYLLGNEC